MSLNFTVHLENVTDIIPLITSIEDGAELARDNKALEGAIKNVGSEFLLDTNLRIFINITRETSYVAEVLTFVNVDGAAVAEIPFMSSALILIKRIRSG